MAKIILDLFQAGRLTVFSLWTCHKFDLIDYDTVVYLVKHYGNR